MKPLVIIESPFAGDIHRNLAYAKRCLLDSIKRGEAPIAFHMLYPQVLDDSSHIERTLGMELSFEWYPFATLCAVYQDYGCSPGMTKGVLRAVEVKLEVEMRYIGENPERS